jgi:hypothetical protein
MRILIICAIFFIVIVCSGCIIALGGSEREIIKEKMIKPTAAQEIRDLKRLKDEGIITLDEYEQAKKRILEMLTENEKKK